MAQRGFAEVASSFEKLVLTDGAQACHVESVSVLLEYIMDYIYIQAFV